MKVFIFSIVWTFGCSVILYFWSQDTEFQTTPWYFQTIFLAMPVFGTWFVVHSLKKLQRNQSLVITNDAEGPLYQWIDVKGQEVISRVDPRPKWAEEDRLDDP